MLKIDSRVYNDDYEEKGTIIAFDKAHNAVVRFDDGGIRVCMRSDLKELPNLEDEFLDQVNQLLRKASGIIHDAQELARTKSLTIAGTDGGSHIFESAQDLLNAMDNGGWNTSTMTAEC